VERVVYVPPEEEGGKREREEKAREQGAEGAKE
jgi:hypothetical protein